MVPLTTRQHEMLVAIQDSQEAHGYAPTIRELGARLGVASPNSVLRQLERLQRNGYITRLPGKARCLAVVRDP